MDELDRELEQRGHRFIRYADDCNIYVRTKRGGERVLAGVTHWIETRLKLRVNREKSAVDRAFLDCLIQQALLQVLTPIFDPHFSAHS